MSDLRTMLEDVTRQPPAADPIGAVRAVIRRRQRRRTAVAAAAVGSAVAATALGVVAVRDVPTVRRVQPMATSTHDGLPSGGSVRATQPADNAVDTQNPGLIALGAITSSHPEAFVGTYVDANGVAVVAFGPRADANEWAARLHDAAGAQAWRTTRCAYDRSELAQVQADLASFAWPSGKVAFGADVDAATCSVVLRTDQLTSADQRALAQRFGDRVNVDKSGHPSRR